MNQTELQALAARVQAQGTRFLVVTGGVCSSIGKGVLISSIGVLLKDAGYRVSVMKCDPYLNVDPGTMSPLEHGEVFVTNDGAETDLDLGHYERMLGVHLTKSSSITSGKVYSHLLNSEREGEYLGKCVQLVPHATNEIQRRLFSFALEQEVDFVLVEIGGVVGDIEGEIFLESIRQLRQLLPTGHVLLNHLSLVPYLHWANETKTKPTQHSVMALKRFGLAPDTLFLRTEKELSSGACDKVATMCGVDRSAVFHMLTRSPVYRIFDDLNTQGVLRVLLERAGLPAQRQATLEPWHNLMSTIAASTKPLRLGMIAKYVGSNDPYMSLVEALKTAGYEAKRKVELVTIDAESLEGDQALVDQQLKDLDGIVLPGGFGTRGLAGKVAAARWAREHNKPYLGICLGMQVLLIEAARNLLKLPTANSMEFDAETSEPVISLIDEQQKVVRKGGTMRLGAYPCDVVEGTHAHKAYGAARVLERHRHRFECNNDYVERFAEKGITVAGRCPDNGLVEIVEHKDHPFMVGVQFHPEYLSNPLQPHPLIARFVEKCVGE